MKHKTLLFLAFLFWTAQSFAQEQVEMAEGMRSSGKIYVVVSTLALIFTGLAIYLVLIDRKLSKLEKDLQD